MIYRYSGIETALRCQRRFYIEYIQGLRQEGATPIELAFGTGLHSALQALFEGEDPQLTFETYWASVSAARVPDTRYQHAELGGMAREFIRKFERHRSRLEPQYLEKNLRCSIGGLQWEGTPDFLGLYQGVPSVVDYKTSGYNYLPEKILSNPQMPLYAHMAKQALGFDAKQIVYYVFVKSTGSIQVQTAELTPGLLNRALETCINMAQDLQKQGTAEAEFSKNHTSCMMGKRVCPWFNKCWK